MSNRVVPGHKRVNVNPRHLTRVDRVIAYLLGIRFAPDTYTYRKATK